MTRPPFLSMSVPLGAVEEKAVLQRKCSAAEARMRSARKTFDRTRKPLEEVVRAQREELARRKVPHQFGIVRPFYVSPLRNGGLGSEQSLLLVLSE